MKLRAIIGPFAIAAALVPAPAATAPHPYHITMAEADYNAETSTLEIALRVYHPGDLEEALGRRAGHRVDLERTEEVDELILDYLEDAFVVTPPGSEVPSAIAWVGKEVDVKTTWLYFEVALEDGPIGATYTNKLLFEVEPDQSNTIVFGRGKGRRTLRFTRDDATKTLRPVGSGGDGR